MWASLLFGVLVFEGARGDLDSLTPDPKLSAQDVVTAQLEALEDLERRNLSVFLRLSEPRFAAEIGGTPGLERALEGRLAGLAGHEQVLMQPAGPGGGHTSLLVVVVHHGRPLGFVFELSKSEDDCWRTSDVRRIDLPSPPASASRPHVKI